MTYPTPDAAGSDTPDFTVNREPHCFTISPDRFCAPAIISSVTLRRLATLHAQMSEDDLTSVADVSANGKGPKLDADKVGKQLNSLADMFRLLLPGRYGLRFAERLLSDGDPGDSQSDPPREASPPVIDLTREAMPAMYWLMEKYGLRPTQPSSPSLDGSTDGTTSTPSDGISSTAGVSPEVSASPN